VELTIQGKRYKLSGIVYYRANHFTCTVIHNQDVWHHDGFQPIMTNLGTVAEQASLSNLDGQTAAAIYTLTHM